MKDQWIQTFRSWSKQREYKLRLRDAREMIGTRLIEAQRGYIAYSGGKDSLAMMHLILSHDPETMVLHWDYGRYYIPQFLHDEIIYNAFRVGARQLRIESSPEYEKQKREAKGILGRHMIGELIPRLKREGYDLAFVGLRKEESCKRRCRIKAERQVGIINECWPLADWTWMDVWSYIVSNELPWLSHYDRQAELIGYERSRFTTLFDPEFVHFGSEPMDNILYWRERNK